MSGRVKNKAPAPVQITAEQLLRDAADHVDDDAAPQQQQQRRFADVQELLEYRMGKRKQFEDALRRNRSSAAAWLKYAAWEETQRDLERTRSVFERALDEDHRNAALWVKYAEMEMRNKNVARARNVWDRAVALLPRVDQLWYKYAFMEDVLGNYAGARGVFERWTAWNPGAHAWVAFAKFEMRVGEVARARQVHERAVAAQHPSVAAWLRYARFEEKRGDVARARMVYSRAVDELGGGEEEGGGGFGLSRLFLAFARFEEKAGEDERARAIFRYALDRVPRGQAEELYQAFAAFEKSHGDRQGIEDVVVSRRRFFYEEELKRQRASKDAVDYDVWFDYIRLEEENGQLEQIREVYERAVANVPPAEEKRFWRRYIFIWLKYAVFEELVAGDAERAREVLSTALKLVPHKRFSFAKLWIHAAKFELRQLKLDAARKTFGSALGLCPDGSTCRAKVYREYIRVEYQLGEIDRCRKLYAGLISNDPTVCKSYIQFAEMERTLREVERSRAILELAVAQPELDMPELLWRHFIDFEIALEEHDRARALYRRLLERTKHVKVWISFAQFEHAVVQDDSAARAVFEEANAHLRSSDLREERALLLETWLAMEEAVGDPARIEEAKKRLPRRIKKRRVIKGEDGSDAGWEEFWEYLFPDQEGAAPHLRLLERARLWKKQKQAAEASAAAAAAAAPSETAVAPQQQQP